MSGDLDLETLAADLVSIRAQLAHHERDRFPFGLPADVEALRRLLARHPELVTRASRDQAVAAARSGMQSEIDNLKAQAARAWAERDESVRSARRQCADLIRSRCSDYTVPAKLRREGVLLAADWLHPADADGA